MYHNVSQRTHFDHFGGYIMTHDTIMVTAPLAVGNCHKNSCQWFQAQLGDSREVKRFNAWWLGTGRGTSQVRKVLWHQRDRVQQETLQPDLHQGDSCGWLWLGPLGHVNARSIRQIQCWFSVSCTDLRCTVNIDYLDHVRHVSKCKWPVTMEWLQSSHVAVITTSSVVYIII